MGGLASETLQRNANALGQIEILTKLIEAKVEEMTETNYEEK